MKYVPLLMSLDAEMKALENQSFSSSVIPLVQIIKDKKLEGGKANVLDDIQSIIEAKANNCFFITVPRNLNLSKKKLKKPVQRFFTEIEKNPSYHISILERFAKYPNVIPVVEVNLDRYAKGDLLELKASISKFSDKLCYRVNAKRLDIIKDELSEIISEKDYLIYDLDSFNFDKKSIKEEIRFINSLKKTHRFKSIVIKQIYQDLTFYKFPNRKITKTDEAYDCIDFDFYDDLNEYKFDYFGDWAGIRNNPIYDGGSSYPSYLTLEVNSINHHGFKGKAQDITSYESIVLPTYLSSIHWQELTNSDHKTLCFGCSYINKFRKKTEKINDATKWKCITISHFICAMDQKLNQVVD